MELYYTDLGAWGDEYDGDEWTYEIDDSQMEDFFVDWNLDNFIYEKKKEGKELTKEEKLFAKQLLRSVARNNDGIVDDLCEDLKDEVADYFRDEAYEDMVDWKQSRADDESDYYEMRYNNCRL